MEEEKTVAEEGAKEEIKVNKPPSASTWSEETKAKAAEGRRRARERAKEIAAMKAARRKTKPLPITPEKINDTPKGKTSASWRPYRITDLPTEMKDARYAYRFIGDNPNSLRKRLMEQWEVDTEIARKMDAQYGARTMDSGNTVDGAYRVNELILVRMPIEVAESRKKYFQDKTPVQNPRDIKRTADQLAREGGAPNAFYTQNPLANGILPDMNKSGKWDGTT